MKKFPKDETLININKDESMAALISYNKIDKELHVTAKNQEIINENLGKFPDAKLDGNTVKLENASKEDLRNCISATQGSLHKQGYESDKNIQITSAKIWIAVTVFTTLVVVLAVRSGILF